MSKKRVLVGLSGGIDSSVVAALFCKQGFDVSGVFFKMFRDQMKSAKKVGEICRYLKIPFYVFDVSKEFKKQVVNYFIGTYESGRTPNPCIVCNKKIKFKYLFEKAKKLGCNYISTGHYAQVKCKTKNEKRKTTIQNLKQYQLYKAKDKKKDQSYFLYRLNRNQLRHILFPLGEYTKDQVKKLAKKFGLPIYTKKESQNVCFIPDNDIKKFLEKYAKKLKEPGKIVDACGSVLGKHNGLLYYTIGQRENLPKLDYSKLSISINQHRRPALYVVKLNIKKNELVIGSCEDLYSKKVNVEKIHWINPYENRESFFALVKIRSTAKKEKCKIDIKGKNIMVEFQKPQMSVTAGQSIVIYKNKEVLGGGIIK